MKIGLIGYGKMGKTIEALCIERGHTIVARLNSASTTEEWTALAQADVSIEFTRPEAALDNFKRCFEAGYPLVTGTTGWYDHMDEVEAMCAANNASFFWASNFSVGVNLFWQINQKLAALMAGHSDYSVSMTEIHHTQKLDEPSGTAITTANQIIAHHPGYRAWKLQQDTPGAHDISIEALREGDVKGTHIVRYESDIDRVEFKHEAKTRKGFALGSVLAAEFLQGKQGLFSMKDLLGF